MTESPFNSSNEAMTNLQKWIDQALIMTTGYFNDMSPALQLMGCIRGVWFDKSILNRVKCKSMRKALLQAQMECIHIIPTADSWINFSCLPDIEEESKDLNLNQTSAWFDYISILDIIQTGTHDVTYHKFTLGV